LVRTVSGEGESILEGLYAFRQRLSGAAGSLAEAYGWGKILGMTFPWIVDWGSRLAGVDVYGIEGFYIPYFYALSDQMGANVSGFLFFSRKEGSLPKTLRRYFTDPVMVASLTVILIVPLCLFCARVAGFSPTTQTFTALETIAANLCWLPPLIGWIAERQRSEQNER